MHRSIYHIKLFNLMKIKKIVSGSLLIKDRPLVIWAFGLFFIFIGILFLAGLAGAYKNLAELPFFQKLITSIVSLGILGGGMGFISNNPWTKTTFNFCNGDVKLKRIGLFGTEKQNFSINEIEKFNLAEYYSRDGTPVYKPVIKLKSDELIFLSMLWYPQKKEIEKIVDEMSTFL